MLDFVMRRIVGTKNDRDLKKMRARVEAINRLEEGVRSQSDEELAANTPAFRQRIEQGEPLDDLLVEAFAVVRETARRAIGERPFDVQLVGAIVLHEGKIAEMKTGEGKTLSSTMPLYLNALTGRGTHLVTVNEYLAERDAEWMGQIYKALGLTVGVTLESMNHEAKQSAYQCDITYGTNSEFGFDYLRDNSSARHRDERVQRELHYAIVDEVDSVLVDEARSPHIISQRRSDTTDYVRIARVIQRLKEEQHYEVDEKRSTRGSASLTEDGIDYVEREFGVSNLYDPQNIDLNHHVTQSLMAHALYARDVDYVVHEGHVVIVDEHTGRMQPGRRFGDGLHQALEAKERVRIVEESQTVARITFQNYFRMYEKLAGMTGTAATEAVEFHQIYGLDVVVVPTNMPMVRDDRPDYVYRNMAGKMSAVVEEIRGHHDEGRPVLVGTVSIEASEAYSRALTKLGIPHRVLNAKEHAKEAEIIAHAGRPYAVTIATNMAGRGVDIKLGEGVRDLQGLVVIGTERHDSRRIDNQLRGRSGRQGDPGMSRFYLSLEDELMRRFGSERIMGMMDRFGMEENIPIEHGMVSRAIEKAQERVEQSHFDIRKQLLKFDNVLNQQREVVYSLRNRVLDGENLRDDMLRMIEDSLDVHLDEFLPEEDREAWNHEGLIQWVTRSCGVETELTAEEASSLGADAIRESLLKAFHRQYDLREQELGADVLRQLERLVALDRIDQHWMEHLGNIDYIQEGIGFRGYAGKDPVTEFQREAFDLFESMLLRIDDDVAQYMFRVSVQAGMANMAGAGGEASSATPTARARQAQPSAGTAQAVRGKREYGKVGRNDPCPCGSGKKHKHCHGRLG